jgi:hypothetical protein
VRGSSLRRYVGEFGGKEGGWSKVVPRSDSALSPVSGEGRPLLMLTLANGELGLLVAAQTTQHRPQTARWSRSRRAHGSGRRCRGVLNRHQPGHRRAPPVPGCSAATAGAVSAALKRPSLSQRRDASRRCGMFLYVSNIVSTQWWHA